MKPETVTQLITLTLLFLMFLLQVRNFIKYRAENGANRTRIILMITTLAFMTHTVRLILDFAQGYFFALGILGYLYLYMQDWIDQTRAWIKDKFK